MNTIQVHRLQEALASEVKETVCAESPERTPFVLYSAIDHAVAQGSEPASFERESFPNATAVSGPTLSVRSRRIAVLRSLASGEPHASPGEPGRYEGVLTVFDAATAAPLCQTKVNVVSDANLRWEDASRRAIHQRYIATVRSTAAAAAKRLGVELDL
jgi:hypothetical protein